MNLGVWRCRWVIVDSEVSVTHPSPLVKLWYVAGIYDYGFPDL